MLLITGGFGFIGSHTVRALLDQGEACVLIQHKNNELPEFLKNELGSRIIVEQLDLGDKDALLALSKRHKITSIVHLAAPGLGALEPFEVFPVTVAWLANLLEAAQAWQVERITIASTLGVYAGVTELPWREDVPLPLDISPHSIPAYKKIAEVMAGYVTSRTDLDCVVVRLGAIYGPGQKRNATLASRLVHAAVDGTEPDFSPGPFITFHEEEGIDLCYVKDCARGIALVHTAKSLPHKTYNVATGKPTYNKEVAAVLKKIVPNTAIQLPAGKDPNGFGLVPYQDITRIHEDTGYEPQFTVEAAVTDFMDWLHAGHEQ